VCVCAKPKNLLNSQGFIGLAQEESKGKVFYKRDDFLNLGNVG